MLSQPLLLQTYLPIYRMAGAQAIGSTLQTTTQLGKFFLQTLVTLRIQENIELSRFLIASLIR